MTASPVSVVALLQAALEAEQAASYGYGVVGSHLPQTSAEQGTATTDWITHLGAADYLTALIQARGGTPAPAAVAYQLPVPVQTAAQASVLAGALEEEGRAGLSRPRGGARARPPQLWRRAGQGSSPAG